MFPLQWFRRAPPAPLHPSLPAGLRVYAVGDVHGCLAELDRLLALIGDDADAALARGTDCRIILLGDVIDRGPDSRGVLERLASWPRQSRLAMHCLLGNHEAAFADFLEGPAAGAAWLRYGGIETLASYGLRASVGVTDPRRLRALAEQLAAAIPAAHRRFLAGLPPMIEIGDYAFVHAGIRPGRPIERQRRDDLLGIGAPFLDSTRWHGRVIVHGHHVVEAPVMLANRIAVDTGAYMTGRLTALVLDGESRSFLQTPGGTGPS